MTILADLSQAELIAQVEALQARLARANSRKLTLKVSDKGGCSVYGMGKWPVTLYASQWRRLLDMADDIRSFLADNADRLSEKAE